MKTRVKIRGIYSTALTRLVLDGGYSVVDPSVKICERFGMGPEGDGYDILIQDRNDLQGILICGEPERISQVLTFIQENLVDAVLLELGPAEHDERLVRANIELPGASKEILDGIRFSVTPTLTRHHRLRTIDAKALEDAEVYLLAYPEKKSSIEKKLFTEVVLLPLEKAGVVTVHHVRPSGKPMRPREGVLVGIDDHTLVIKRSFSHGRYDGLDLPINPGDYGITEVHEGAWHIKHAYYSRSAELIGEYYNINTPVELYPSGARYLDLEVDVIRRAGQEPFIIDQEKLSLLNVQGSIGNALQNKALEVAEELFRGLRN
jgi:probable ribonuclease FAU-1